MINSSLPVSFSILRKSALLYKFFSVCAFRFPVFQTRMYPFVVFDYPAYEKRRDRESHAVLTVL